MNKNTMSNASESQIFVSALLKKLHGSICYILQALLYIASNKRFRMIHNEALLSRFHTN